MSTPSEFLAIDTRYKLWCETWGDEFDFEVSVPPTLDFALFESILFKKAYYVKWPKIDKNGIFTPYIWPEYGFFVAGWI